MPPKKRLDQIISLLNEHGYLSVGELSQLCKVSEMTIRRDLNRLEKESLIRRTYGGAASPGASSEDVETTNACNSSPKPDSIMMDRVDVLVATSVGPKYDSLLMESVTRNNIPIIAESMSVHAEEPVVSVDNFKAGADMGRWAGQYALEHWRGKACALDLTYSLPNTQSRSRGFVSGLHEVLPEAEVILSINAQSRSETAYQLTLDAISVHPDINIIFAINDSTAWGAMKACKELRIDPGTLIVLPFGLEGNTLKNALAEASYCKAGVAMFPEIVGPTCVETAIAAYNHHPLSSHLITPYVILTPTTLYDYYSCREDGQWLISWGAVHANLDIPLDIATPRPREGNLPGRIGLIVPFSEHEWYKSLTVSMQSYASQLKINFEVIDVDQNQRDEIDLRRRLIACAAAAQIHSGDVIIMDDGPITAYLANELLERKDITIITNSMTVFDILRQNSGVILISTGGAFRRSSQVLVGPTAEGTLSELRADKLFLMVSGISLNFGLSHTNISEVTMKQSMIRSAREVILLADHTYFGLESVIQIAPLSVVDKLITDDALPASVRLELTKLGFQIILATK